MAMLVNPTVNLVLSDIPILDWLSIEGKNKVLLGQEMEADMNPVFNYVFDELSI